MRIEIEIPVEFESDYNDKFADFFNRVLSDIEKSTLCGNYEKETAEMFLKAFADSKPAYDAEKVVVGWKKKKEIANRHYNYGDETAYRHSIEIVNQLAEEYKHCIKSSCSNCEVYDKEKHYCPKWCDVIKNTVKEIEENHNGWIPCSRELPPHSDDLLLIQCSGKPKNNIIFDNAFCLASYTEEGWILEMYPEWKDAEVIAWMPLPESFQPKGE